MSWYIEEKCFNNFYFWNYDRPALTETLYPNSWYCMVNTYTSCRIYFYHCTSIVYNKGVARIFSSSTEFNKLVPGYQYTKANCRSKHESSLGEKQTNKPVDTVPRETSRKHRAAMQHKGEAGEAAACTRSPQGHPHPSTHPHPGLSWRCTRKS